MMCIDEFSKPCHLTQTNLHMPNEILSLIAEHCVDLYDIWCAFSHSTYPRPLQRRSPNDPKAEACSENELVAVSRAFSAGIREGIRSRYTGKLCLQHTYGWSSGTVNAQTVIEKHNLHWVKSKTTCIKIWSEPNNLFSSLDFNQLPNLEYITIAHSARYMDPTFPTTNDNTSSTPV